MGQTGRAVQWGLRGGAHPQALHFATRTTSGDGGMPGGMPQGGAAPEAEDEGPKIEEVD